MCSFLGLTKSDMLYSIADMKATTALSELEQAIHAIQQDLLAVGPMHPGSVSRQYQVCGRPGCRCMREKDPQRHGPYHKLSYVRRGRPVCRFVRAECVAEVTARVAAYRTFRRLVDRWIELSVQRGVVEFFDSVPAGKLVRAPSQRLRRGSRAKNTRSPVT